MAGYGKDIIGYLKALSISTNNTLFTADYLVRKLQVGKAFSAFEEVTISAGSTKNYCIVSSSETGSIIDSLSFESDQDSITVEVYDDTRISSHGTVEISKASQNLGVGSSAANVNVYSNPTVNGSSSLSPALLDKSVVYAKKYISLDAAAIRLPKDTVCHLKVINGSAQDASVFMKLSWCEEC